MARDRIADGTQLDVTLPVTVVMRNPDGTYELEYNALDGWGSYPIDRVPAELVEGSDVADFGTVETLHAAGGLTVNIYNTA